MNKETRNIIISIITITLLTFIVYYSSLFYGLTNWDDDGYITNDIHIKQLSLKSIQNIFSIFYDGNYHPLLLLVYSVIYSVFQLNPIGYHLFNVAFHLFNCVLVFWLIYKITDKIPVAFIVGLLFGIHPMHVESVTWISGTKDVLYTLFYLSALISYYYYLTKSFNKKYYLLSILLFVLSCTSKAMAVTLPLVLFLIDYILLRKITFKTIIEKVPFLIISLVIGILAILAQQSVYAIKDFTSYSYVEKFIIGFYGMVFYIYKMIIPTDLSPIYPYPDSNIEFFSAKFLVCPLIVIGLIVFLYHSRKNTRLFIVGFMFYLLNILLILQIIAVGGVIAADRYFYLSSIGLFLIVGYAANYVYERFHAMRNLIIGFFVIIIMLISLKTFYQQQIWKDSYTLWTDIIDTYPNSNGIAIAFNNMGILKSQDKKYNEAIDDYNEAIRRNSSYDVAYFNRGLAKNYLKDYKHAIDDFNSAEKYKPKYFDLYYNRAISKFNINDFVGCINDNSESIKNNKDNAKAYYNRGVARFNIKDYNGAIDDYTKTIALEKNNGTAYNNRGYCKSLLSRYDEAISDYNSALRYTADNAFAYNNRGYAKAKLLRYDDAIADCEKSLAMLPNNAYAYFNLGFIYYNKKDFSNALKNLNKAIELKPDYTEAKELLKKL